MLCQEPWCFTPQEVARLTDWQIEHLYAKPALERAERLRNHAPGTPERQPLGNRPRVESASTGPPDEPGSAEHRSACIRAFMDVQGLSPQRAAEQYDRQLAQWREASQQEGKTP